MAVGRHAARADALEDLWVWRPFDIKKSDRAFLQPAEAMVDENISSGNHGLNFHHRRAALQEQGRLHIAQGLGGAFRMDLVEISPIT